MSIHREEFDIDRTLVARRPFSAGGRHFLRGQKFGWRRLSISQRRVRQMYEAGWLMYSEPVLSVAEEPPVESPSGEESGSQGP